MVKVMALGVFIGLCLNPFFLFADNKDSSDEKKAAVQNVGGLLFDVDEGVKVEKGPGGSVYVKSNREYMDEKFREIDAKFQMLDERITKLEGASAEVKSAEKAAEKNRRVLST